MAEKYDLVIMGAGLAGLHIGIESLKKQPDLRCCILEKYNYIGGRVITYKKDIPKVGEVQWENGAGRISTKHRTILNLLKKYKLTFLPINPDTDYVNDPSLSTSKIPIRTGNNFSDMINVYLKPLERLPKDVLATHTIKELLDKTLGRGSAKDFYIKFPYYSEIHTLRADLALNSFKNEMKSNEGFGVCLEGLSALINAMAEEFKKLGGIIFLNTEVYKVTGNYDLSVSVMCRESDGKDRIFYGKTAVAALHSEAIKNIRGLRTIPILKHLTMEPLLRIYAVFPIKKGGVVWFSGINKTVTNSPVRFIIPIDEKRGIIMISYTDGADARHWFKEKAGKHGEDNVRDLIMKEVRELFPDRTIPDPLFFKLHPWTDGCTYWKPGDYCPYEESRRSLYPLPSVIPNLFMCGESFAVRQCWMESALEQADKLLYNRQFQESIGQFTFFDF